MLHVRPFIIYESLPTRMDSLLVGAAIALVPLPSTRNALFLLLAGAAAYLVAIRISHNSFFPVPWLSPGLAVSL